MTHDDLYTAVCIEVFKFCAASSLRSVNLSEIFRLVAFSKFFEKELQLTYVFNTLGHGLDYYNSLLPHVKIGKYYFK